MANRVYGCILKSPTSRVLLVRGRLSGKWSFPKGHAYKDETPTQCAIRETMEETGLKPFLNVNSVMRLSKGTYFMAPVSKEIHCKPKDTKEVSEARWVSLSEIPSLSCNVDVNNYYRRNMASTIQRSAAQTIQKPKPFLAWNELE